MNIEELRDFCLSLKGAGEKMPFDDKFLVFTVKDKMFCLTNLEEYDYINLKCDPEKAILLREEFEEVTLSYHINKKHWNSVATKGNISISQMKEWIVDSYNLVVKGLPKKLQKELLEE